MRQDILIKTDQLYVQRSGQDILTGIDLTLRRGEITTLIGPNGSGKTTLAHVLLGLIKPSSGSLTCLPKIRFGFVPQSLSIDRIFPLTAGHFYRCRSGAMPRRSRGRPKRLWRSLASAILPIARFMCCRAAS